ncbi:hypothetical protein FEM03_09965 [Phragmitibacter flavus]|uniref:Uncharacterized protein n=1 Tax=Phragmitibacter flavus TaxID=2576071 RepID=A0A5R8KF79_9BACT|nr:hypothetical protein [Phragmitibacter flavus]TLD70635.1 hypothetical protein FEM03_09965 [Phragmitibacter flavus]
MVDLEEIARKGLLEEGQKGFYELFYFASENEYAQETRVDMKEMFEAHFKSGIGEVEVWSLKEKDFHDYVMGSLTMGILRRSPGIPLAFINISPKDENDPEGMSLCFLFAKVDDGVRVVFEEPTGRESPFLEDGVSVWKKKDGESFRGRFVRVLDGKAYFRSDFMDGLVVPVEMLAAEDRSRAEALERAEKKGSR